MKKLLVMSVISLVVTTGAVQAVVLEGVCLQLLKVTSSHLFKNYLEDRRDIRLQGAPKWYYNNKDEQHICVFASEQGAFEAVEKVREKTRGQMVEKINRILAVVSEDQKNLLVLDQQDRDIVESFKFDADATNFVQRHLDIDRLDYRQNASRVFSRGCLSKQALLDYQKQRLVKLQMAIVDKRAKSAFDELESF